MLQSDTSTEAALHNINIPDLEIYAIKLAINTIYTSATNM